MKKFYLYDPRHNVLTETSYDFLSELTGKSKENLASVKNRGTKIRSLGCYFVDEDVTVKQRKEWYLKEEFPGERWKPLEGSVRGIFISDHGRFKWQGKRKEIMIMPYLFKGRHMDVKVDFRGVRKAYRVSRLVAYHFIGEPPDGKKSVWHKNGLKYDNFFGNLEYISRFELGSRTGQESQSRPVTQFDAFTGEYMDEFRSAREAGRRTYLSYQAVLDNCNGETKVAGGLYKFRFTDDYETNRSE